MTVRFFMLQCHYASTLDFSNEALQAAEKGLKRLMTALETMNNLPSGTQSDFDVSAWKLRCAAAMNDDFNTPILISELFEAVKLINSAKDGSLHLTSSDIEQLQYTMNDYVYEVLGLQNESSGDNELSGNLMQLVIKLRAEAKDRKDYATSDQIRDELIAMSVKLKDSKDGTSWEYEK